MCAATVLAANSSPEASIDGTTEHNEFEWRVLSLTNLLRLVVCVLLFGAFLASSDPRILGDAKPTLFALCLVVQLGFALSLTVLLRRRSPSQSSHLYIQLIGDVVIVTGLAHASGGVSSGLGGLLIVTVGSLGLLVPGQRAYLFAAVAALAILGEQTFSEFAGLTGREQFVPAGILGAVLFLISAVVSSMGHRMRESEALAEQRGVDLANLAELNEYIIQHLRESIVVVDERDRVRLMNESAAGHLGAPTTSAGKPVAEISSELSRHLARWRSNQSESHSASLKSADGATNINVNLAQLGPHRDGALLIFLEDTIVLAEKAQQQKLAALGRLSASIAHEIRNPIGAMSHAGQLLAESPAMGEGEQRLTNIIQTNATRVSDIVESVLGLSRRDAMQPEEILLSTWLPDFAKEFSRTLELYEDAMEVHSADAELSVRMDPTHLRQVVWNLCDNAVKYASEAAGAITVTLECGRIGSGRPFLDIADRGPGIQPEAVDEVFEPFYTAGRGGTGLGLFISKQLCECNGATLRYQSRPGGGSIFRIIFADPDRWQIS
jgi:two-component system sensor histidine kinase PilS (NtrC family)